MSQPLHGLGQSGAVLQRSDGDLAAGNGLAQLLHGVLAVGVELVLAVEDGDLAGAVQSGLDADGGGGAAGTQHHQLLALDLHAVFVEVADKADAVGVVAGQLAVLAHGDGVAGADQLGSRGELIQQGSATAVLSGHGDVEAAHLQGLQGLQRPP